MFFRMVYDEKLAQAAYLIGCQKTGEAVVIDPERDVDRYIDLAKANNLRITAIAETHIHADYLSGARELAERTGAKLYLSDEGDKDWKYGWLNKKTGGGAYNHQLLHDGDVFKVGNIDLKAIHTPGHTPEHICFLVTDKGGGASEPMGIATGDFVFVGDLGRPDLLETAAGQMGAKEPSARRLYGSLPKFKALPDYLQVWPGHGAGSACGKALGAVPQTTVGYEKRFNAAITAATSEAAFVDFILSGQPEPPLYFARMKRENRDGPAVLGALPRPRALTKDDLGRLDGKKTAIVDTRAWAAFKAGHIPGSFCMPLDNQFPTLAGSLLNVKEPVVLVVEAARVDEAVRDLVRVGIDRIEAFAEPALVEAWMAPGGGGKSATSKEIDAPTAVREVAAGKYFLFDARRADEFEAGRIPGAMNTTHLRSPTAVEKLPRNKPILVNCRSGVRSSRVVALLERHGFDVTNLGGGFLAWEKAGGPVEK